MIWNRKKPFLAEMTFSKLLSGKYSNKEIMHYEISLGDSGIYYEPGDSLAVIPTNDHNLVLAIIDRLDVNSSKFWTSISRLSRWKIPQIPHIRIM